MSEDLKVGFTGTPSKPATGVRKVAIGALDAVKRETSAVAAGAVDHPHTATGIFLSVGALAFVVGYVFGRASGNDSSYWR
jgi:hypothetical protein